MTLQEIVCAVLDHHTITTDPSRIEVAKALGQPVRYVTRVEATLQGWLPLAAGTALFLSDGISLYRHQPKC
jgi:hypothetical protein